MPELATEGGLCGAESGEVPPLHEDMAMFLSPLPVVLEWHCVSVSSFFMGRSSVRPVVRGFIQSGMYEVCLQLPARLV